MPLRPCLVCGQLGRGSYCARHQPTHPSRDTPGRSSTKQTRFRLQVLQAAGWQCQAIEGGQRCQVKSDLQAHHLVVFRHTGSMDPRDGLALCRKHHAQPERAAEM